MRTRVGYCGGTKDNPTYSSLGDHTETTQIDFDPAVISYEKILQRVWEEHDPTAAPYSRQYMAAIFFDGDEQKKLAEASRDRVAKRLGKPVQTKLLPLERFWRAEDYHQKYYLRGNAALMRHFDAKTLVDSIAAARANGFLGGHGSEAEFKAERDALKLTPELGRALAALIAGRK